VAIKTTTRLIDDLDGGPAERTIPFSLDGVQYEIDLGKKNSAALEKALRPYLDAARRVRAASAGSRRNRSGNVRSGNGDLRAIREWARSNGYEISDRGRIAAPIMDAYKAVK
jgi:Lsr2